MSVTRYPAAIQGIPSDHKHHASPGLFIRRALFLFVASVGSFIGAAILPAGI